MTQGSTEKHEANEQDVVTAPQSTPELSREQIEDIVETLRRFATAYPEDIFTPLTPEQTEQHSLIITRASAAMGRHCAQFFTQGADTIEQLLLRTLKAEAELDEAMEKVRYYEAENAHIVTLAEDRDALTAELSRKQDVIRELVRLDDQYRPDPAPHEWATAWAAARAEIEEGKTP